MDKRRLSQPINKHPASPETPTNREMPLGGALLTPPLRTFTQRHRVRTFPRLAHCVAVRIVKV